MQGAEETYWKDTAAGVHMRFGLGLLFAEVCFDGRKVCMYASFQCTRFYQRPEQEIALCTTALQRLSLQRRVVRVLRDHVKEGDCWIGARDVLSSLPVLHS